jgi:hypothetical protein
VTPAILDKLPAAVHHHVAVAYSQSIETVFTIATPIAAIAFLVAWLIPQVELRRGVGAGGAEPAEGAEGASRAPAPSPPVAPATAGEPIS